MMSDEDTFSEYDNLPAENDSNGTVFDCNSVGPEGLLSSVYFQMAVYTVYVLIFLIALGGNGLVCYVVQSSPRMRTVTNYFIGNLAVGDILMALFCVPFSCVPVLLQHWPFGLGMCRLVSYTQAVSVLAWEWNRGTAVVGEVTRVPIVVFPILSSSC